MSVIMIFESIHSVVELQHLEHC